MTHKQVPAMLLAATLALTGCSWGIGQTQVSSSTHCCLHPMPAELASDSCAINGSIDGPARFGDFEARGGNAWVAKNGEYCVGEGNVVTFPDGHRIEGPKRGNY